MSEAGSPIPRSLSENNAWNQRHSTNIIFDAKIEHDSSITPRTEPPKPHWHPHQVQDLSISPQVSQKNEFSKQVSFHDDVPLLNSPKGVVIGSPKNSSKSPSGKSASDVPSASNMTKARSLNFLHSSSDSKKNESSEEKDMFEVEKQLKTLHRSIEASKQKEHNSYVQIKPFYYRFLACGFVTQPSHRNMEQILNSAKTCDLFFQRKGEEFEGDLLSEDLLRGVKSTLDGKYMPKTCHLKLWSHVGIIIALTSKQTTPKPSPRGVPAKNATSPAPRLSLIADEAPARRQSFLSRIVPQSEVKSKYLLVTTERGISLRHFEDVLSTCDLILKSSLPTGRYVAAYRPIRVTKLGIPQYCHMCDYLEEIARFALAAGGLLLWRDLFTIHQHLLNTSIPSSDSLPPLPFYLSSPQASISSFNFLQTFFTRLSSVAYRPSNESIAEAIRCFHLIATAHLSDANFAELEHKSKSGKGFLKSQYEVITIESLRNGLRGILRISVSDQKGVGNDGAESNNSLPGRKTQEAKGGMDANSSHQLEILLNAFEAESSNDGMISLDEFLNIFLSLPSPTIPVEFEFPSVTMAELLASIFHAMGIFSDDYLSSCRGQSFHPQSFSSTHTVTRGALLRGNSGERRSGKWPLNSPKANAILPITDGYQGPSASSKGFTQSSTFNQTPLAKRDLKKKFALWYEKDILMTN